MTAHNEQIGEEIKNKYYTKIDIENLLKIYNNDYNEIINNVIKMEPRYINDYINSVLKQNKKINDDELEKLVSAMMNQAKENQEMINEDFPEAIMFTIYHILMRIPESAKRNECIDILCDFVINFKIHYYAAKLMNTWCEDFFDLREFTWNDITEINVSPVITDRNLNKVAEILSNSQDILSSTSNMFDSYDNTIENINVFLNNILICKNDGRYPYLFYNFKLKKEYYDKYMNFAIECLKTNKLAEKINRFYQLYRNANADILSKEDLDNDLNDNIFEFQDAAIQIFGSLGALQREGLLEENEKLNERIDQAAKCIIELDNGDLAYAFADAISSYPEQDAANIMGKDNANKLANIILKSAKEGSLYFTQLGCFVTKYAISEHLNSDTISKFIDIMIELSNNEINNHGSLDCFIISVFFKFYVLYLHNKNVKQNDLSKINNHILKIGTLKQIIVHAYYDGDEMNDVEIAKITEKIKNSKDARAIYEYITCWDKKGDLEYYYYDDIKWIKKPTRLKDKDVLVLIKTLIEAENIEISLLNDNDFQTIRELVEDSNNYKEFSDKLHKLYDKNSDKRNNEIGYSDDFIYEKNNGPRSRVLGFFRKIKNSKKS